MSFLGSFQKTTCPANYCDLKTITATMLILMHSRRDKVNTYHMPENVLGNILEYLETCVTGDIALVLLQSQLAFLVQ